MDIFVGLIEANEGVNYASLLYCVAIYLVLLWLAVSAWVAKDALRRYENNWTAFGWFLAVFFLNFPALMFYIVVRPDDPFDAVKGSGGVNVPLVNFVSDKNEFVFGIQMKINGNELTEQVRDMHLTIDWDTQDKDKEITSESLVAEAELTQRKMDKVITKLRGNLSARRQTLRNFISNVRSARLERGSSQSLDGEIAKVDDGIEEVKATESDLLESQEKQVETEILENEDTGEAKIQVKADKKSRTKKSTAPLSPADSEDDKVE